MRALLTSLLFVALLAPDLWAQRVTGVLVSSENAAPVQGAIVVLEDEGGDTRAGTLSDAQGRFTLTAPAAGRYRVKAERLGFEAALSAYLEVAAGQSVEQRLVLAPRAVDLQGITVRGSRRCQARPEAGLETHRVWEEARRGLRAVALTESLRFVSFRIWSYDRELDRSGRVLSDQGHARLVLNDYPFRSDPRAELMRRGFVQQVGEEIFYHAPDAHVLLSDEFLEGYCFSVRREAGRPGQIALAFEPTPQRQHLPGVVGALWLDEGTGELRQLEYRYVRVSRVPESASYGGQLDFERLENGAWIVRSWTIRVPSFQAARTRGALLSLGTRETGGEVTAVTHGEETRLMAGHGGVVRGRLLDAEERTPVEGAVVYLSGTQYETTTDAAGDFEMVDVRAGMYTLSVYHPERRIAGELLPTREVSVRVEDAAAVELLLPGVAAQMVAMCGGPGEGRGVVIAGMVRDEGTGVGLGGARVELRPAAGTGPVLHVLADEDGRYYFCDIPRGGAYRLRAAFATHRSAERELALAGEGAGEAVRSDLGIDLRTPLRLTGRVLDGESGQPVASARVRILGTEHAALTDARGRFLIAHLPSGEHRVEVTHIAYGTHSEAATVRGGEVVDLTIHLGMQAIAIEGVVATAAARVPPGLEDFHRRMSQSRGGGVFFDRAAIERRGALRVEHMLAEHGFVVSGAGVVNPRGFSGLGSCGPKVYIDGNPVTNVLSNGAVSPAAAREALRMVNPAMLDGIEIYRGASQIPIELGGTGGGCGLIALWTKRS